MNFWMSKKSWTNYIDTNTGKKWKPTEKWFQTSNWINDFTNDDNSEKENEAPYPVKTYVKFDPWVVDHFNLKAPIISFDNYGFDDEDKFIALADEVIVEYSDGRAYYAKKTPTETLNNFPNESNIRPVPEDKFSWIKLGAVQE